MKHEDVIEAADRLRAAREDRGWSTTALAAKARELAIADGTPMKLKQQSISAFENGKAASVPHWLKYCWQALNSTEPPTENLDRHIPIDASVMIEVLPTYAGMGGGGTGDGDRQVMSFSRGLIFDQLGASPKDLMAILVEGNSMEPDFLSGDQMLIDKRRLSIAQPGAFCLWDGDGYTVKYLEKVHGSDPHKVRVISRNSIYSSYEILADELQIMGRVIWFARRV